MQRLTTTADNEVVIAVDLDGTLVLTDTLYESAMLLLRDHPIRVFAMPFWLVGGKAALKAKLADNVDLNPHSLPYNNALIEWLCEQRTKGRKLVLCTATDERVARAVANHLNLFDYVFASDGKTNMAGWNKRRILEEQFGTQGFDYVGNTKKDLEVWAGARKAILANAPNNVSNAAEKLVAIEKTLLSQPISLSAWCRVFRVHQYLKNLLLFVPLLAAHQFSNVHSLLLLLLAFVSFSLCASSVYITNDLLDLDSDRHHPHKRYRPFAAGVVPIRYGTVLAPICAIISLVIALIVGAAFAAWLVAYFALTFAYSLRLKRIVLVDCITLAALYTLRIVSGAAVASILLSFWLLAFSVFFFLSLAFVKRYAELQTQVTHGGTNTHGRGYMVGDARLVQTLGVAAGYASVLVLALYVHGEMAAQLYTTPKFIWGAVPLMLYWISWVWLKANRGEMHEDPVVFAVKDKTSWIIAALLTATSLLAIVWGVD